MGSHKLKKKMLIQIDLRIDYFSYGSNNAATIFKLKAFPQMHLN